MLADKAAVRLLLLPAPGFAAPEQLMDVEGIGEATFDGLRELITVEGTEGKYW